MPIHDRALIHASVEIDPSNDIGSNVVIEENVTIGRRNRIHANAYLCAGTSIGDENEIHMNSVLGNTPQDTSFKGEPSFTRIGNGNVIREFVSIHRGTDPGSATEIGDNCFLMAHTHIAHNCRLADRVTLVSQSGLAGHVSVESGAFISGLVAVHQFTRIGLLSMVSGLSALNQDLPPFMIAHGRPATVRNINAVGLRRAGISAEARRRIQNAHRILYRSNHVMADALKLLADDRTPEIQHLVGFIRESARGVMHGPETSPNSRR